MSDQSKAEDLIPPGCGLWLGWIAASIVGAILGWNIGWRASFIVPGVLSTAVLGGSFGLFLGLLQWLVIRGAFKKSAWWVAASVAGWAGGFPLGVDLAQRLGLAEATFGLVAGMTSGALVGGLQWVLLRTDVPGAGWWVLANIFAWTASLIYYRPGITGMGALYGALSGIVTGTTLLWLLYRPLPDVSTK